MTNGNRVWAFTEVKRRAGAMNGAYSIYRHNNGRDYIVRVAGVATAPSPVQWSRVATFQPDGSQSFGEPL